jgi:cyclase
MASILFAAGQLRGKYPSNGLSEVEDRGAGEILLTSIDRDGTLEGYDLELIESVASAVNIPVIACGGCGTYEHMQQAFKAGAHAVAVGAMFQFCEATPRGAARYLNEHGIACRP